MVAPITMQDRENIIKLTVKQGDKVCGMTRYVGGAVWCFPHTHLATVNCPVCVAQSGRGDVLTKLSLVLPQILVTDAANYSMTILALQPMT